MDTSRTVHGMTRGGRAHRDGRLVVEVMEGDSRDGEHLVEPVPLNMRHLDLEHRETPSTNPIGRTYTSRAETTRYTTASINNGPTSTNHLSPNNPNTLSGLSPLHSVSPSLHSDPRMEFSQPMRNWEAPRTTQDVAEVDHNCTNDNQYLILWRERFYKIWISIQNKYDIDM